MVRRPARSWVRISVVVQATVIAAVVGLMVPLVSPPAIAANRDAGVGWSPPTRVYIPETGQAIDGYFLDLWRDGGGFSSFGNPITPESTNENGHVVQYYQYARFEYWPEGDGSGNTVFLADIGEELRPTALRRGSSTGSIAAKDSRSVQGQSTSASADLVALTLAWLPLPGNAGAADSANWRYIPESGHSVANGFKAFWEATGEASYLGNPLTEEYTLGGVNYQIFARGQLAWKAGADSYMVPVGRMLAERYGADTSPMDQGDTPTYSQDLFVAPPPVADEEDSGVAPLPPPGAKQSIVVSLSQQRMWAYEGEDIMMSALVSTGKAGFETPPGAYQILVKKEVEDMKGLIGGEYYDVPQVPNVMYFTDVGHAFHGAYWHNDFGTTRSHGCVNLPLDISVWLYDWTPLGTPVLVVA